MICRKKNKSMNCKDYHIVMLLCNLDFLDFFLEMFPKKKLDGLNFHFMIDTRKFKILNQAKERLKKETNPNFLDNNVFFCDFDQLFEYAIEELDMKSQKFERARNFMLGYVITMKMLLPIYFFKKKGIEKFLYIDDDVLIMKDPRKILDKYSYAMSGDRFLKYDQKNQPEVDVYNEVFNGNLTIDQYNDGRMCTGVMVMSKDENFSQYVKNFYNHNFFIEMFENNKSTKKHTKIFFLDSRFFNFLFKIKYGKECKRFETDEHYFGSKSLCTSGQKKFLKIKTFYHYAVGNTPIKYEWIKAFKNIEIADKNYVGY